MESIIMAILAKIATEPDTLSFPLALIILGVLYYGFKYYIKPMKTKIDTIPSENIINAKNNILEEQEAKHFEQIETILLKLTEFLDDIDKTEKTTSRELSDVKHDVAQIKEILNQFQGHLMYNKRPNDFGNRELR